MAVYSTNQYGHIGTNQKCPDYQGVMSAYVLKGYFGTLTKRMNYASVLILKCPHSQVSTLTGQK